ncbi:stalk domain-containing protein [Paenibacillus piri]|uniref:stalk domain-containing protein n=1 Tax=Paenibacillus piri TaxID=2547395 RepID=UPI0014042AD9|nr:stalk domain-containing protein [Paenibacillus piri]
MDKKYSIGFLLTAIISLSLVLGVYAETDIKLLVNNKEVNTPIEIIDGKSYIPLHAVSEYLGAQVNWNEAARTINVSNSISNKIHVSEGIQTDDGGSYFPVDVQINSGPMIIKISKITLSPNFIYGKNKEALKALILTVEIENTSGDEVIWNLIHGQIVLNTREHIPTGSSFLSDQVDGQFSGKQKKQGNIVFELKGAMDNITSFTYIIDSPLGFQTDYPVSLGMDEAIHFVLRK